jgi:HEPN domain-containing protein
MDPTYFLYAHTVELALKALLQAHSVPIPRSHEIGDLFEDCRAKNLIALDPHFELQNLIALLGSGNEGHRYRYAGKNRRIRPDLPWVHEATGRLMQIVEPHVSAWIKDNSPPSQKRFTIFGKPAYTKQPIPTKSGP